MINDLSDRFVQNVLGLNSENGAAWLADLPVLIAEIGESWSLIIEKPFPDLSYNFVAPCVCANNGTKAVLKIGYNAKDSAFFGEARFLTLAGGKGAVTLLQVDEKRRALLLERLIPGANLAELCQRDDARATAIAIEIMRKICREPPPNHDFPLLADWLDGLDKASQVKFAPRLVDKARRYFGELSKNSERNSLLHGDLHHENILSAERESFLAIDPKGVVGDIGYEIAVFMNNHRRLLRSQRDLPQILARRIEQFSQSFEIEPRKLREWAFIQAVLSAWWVFEDTKMISAKWIGYAEIWEEIGV